MATPFDRDLGYLDAFLGKLRAHAATLPEEAGAALLASLDAQERAWTQIRAQLGQPPADAAHAAAPPPASPPSTPGPTSPGPASIPPGTWTVGTLRGGRA